MNLDQITPLTHQQVFDNALFGVRKDGYRGSFVVVEDPDAIADGGSGTKVKCRYRFEGRACGIGHSIPDELYDPRMEGKAAGSLLVDPIFEGDPDDADGSGPVTAESAALAEKFAALFSAVVTHGDAALLSTLQFTHDGACRSDGAFDKLSFEMRMQDFAANRGLHYTPPTEEQPA